MKLPRLWCAAFATLCVGLAVGAPPSTAQEDRVISGTFLTVDPAGAGITTVDCSTLRVQAADSGGPVKEAGFTGSGGRCSYALRNLPREVLTLTLIANRSPCRIEQPNGFNEPLNLVAYTGLIVGGQIVVHCPPPAVGAPVVGRPVGNPAPSGPAAAVTAGTLYSFGAQRTLTVNYARSWNLSSAPWCNGPATKVQLPPQRSARGGRALVGYESSRYAGTGAAPCPEIAVQTYYGVITFVIPNAAALLPRVLSAELTAQRGEVRHNGAAECVGSVLVSTNMEGGGDAAGARAIGDLRYDVTGIVGRWRDGAGTSITLAPPIAPTESSSQCVDELHDIRLSLHVRTA